mgnify:CR=1 FL=1
MGAAEGGVLFSTYAAGRAWCTPEAAEAGERCAQRAELAQALRVSEPLERANDAEKDTPEPLVDNVLRQSIKF